MVAPRINVLMDINAVRACHSPWHDAPPASTACGSCAAIGERGAPASKQPHEKTQLRVDATFKTRRSGLSAPSSRQASGSPVERSRSSRARPKHRHRKVRASAPLDEFRSQKAGVQDCLGEKNGRAIPFPCGFVFRNRRDEDLNSMRRKRALSARRCDCR